MSRWDTFPGGFPNENAKRSATSVINLPLKGTAAAADGIGKVLETPNDPTPCPVDWLVGGVSRASCDRVLHTLDVAADTNSNLRSLHKKPRTHV